jgi:hypothetical protein
MPIVEAPTRARARAETANFQTDAGKFEIAVQADRLQINGRRAAVSPEKGFDTIVVDYSAWPRPA